MRTGSNPSQVTFYPISSVLCIPQPPICTIGGRVSVIPFNLYHRSVEHWRSGCISANGLLKEIVASRGWEIKGG